MKTRILSALVVFAIFIPIFIIGGNVFKLAFFVVALQGLREYITVREKKKEFPIIIKLISYICLTFFYFAVDINSNLIINFDFRIITGLLLILFLPIFLYDKNKYNINDACQILGGILLIASSMVLLNLYRNMGLKIIALIFMITILTDTFAYFTGILVGKHKLIENISPNKTWEGLIGGSLVATFTTTVYYTTVINTNIPLLPITVIIFILTLIGQFGDLFFSAIKRYYKVKDYSNIMPGHGGVLDRLDSIIFVAIAYSLIITLL